MLYKEWFVKFYQRIFRKALCDPHDWKYTGYSYNTFTDIYAMKREHFKCEKCHKKEKRPEKDGGTFVMF